jgi:hypothetical protein
MYSDLTIVCGGKRYPVHRALLATRSSFFEGACRNSFLEAETGVIDLSEDDAEAVEHMVHCKHDSKNSYIRAYTNVDSQISTIWTTSTSRYLVAHHNGPRVRLRHCHYVSLDALHLRS